MFQLFYIEKTSTDWFQKNPALLVSSERDFIAAFNMRANESFTVAPYSGMLPPAKRVEQKALPVPSSALPVNIPSKDLPENVKTQGEKRK